AVRYPAVRLFADRAAAVRPGFAVDEGNLAAVLRICTALDGLPLALELAAARLRSLPVAQVATRLDDRFRLLSRGDRAAVARHRTLRAVVEWSWDLLGTAEQTLARRLTVFTGGLTLEAAERVCDLPDADELLAELTDKSLLQSDGTRYRMLDTVRAFCAERLDEAGETDRIERRHAAYFLDLARRADPHLRGADQLEWLERLAADHGNLHAALRRRMRADPATALRLVASLTWYWWLRGRIEGASLATELMGVVGLDPPDGLHEEFVLCAVNAVSGGGSADRAEGWLDRAEELLKGIGRTLDYAATAVLWAMTAGPRRTDVTIMEKQIGTDPWSRALIRMSDGFLLQFGGDMDAAEEACAEAVRGFRSCGDGWGVANSLDPLAQIAAWRGDRDRALALLDEALALVERIGALEDTADLLYRRGDIRVQAGELDAAHADYLRGAELARRAGASDKVAGAHHGLGRVARLRGDLAEARRLYESALTGFTSERYIAGAVRAVALVGLGWVALAEGGTAGARRAPVPGAGRRSGAVRVPVYFHVIHDGPTGNVSDATVRRQIGALNASYGGRFGGADTRVSFALRHVDRSDNGGWYYEPDRFERTYKPRLHRGGRNTLNLYSVHIDGDLLGWSTFPWKYRTGPKMDGVTIHSDSMPGGPIDNFNRGFSATHEVGHWLGLYHTFQDGCGGQGDRVADTPPERDPTNGCPGGKDTCPQPGHDPIHNFMDYGYDTCMTSFTSGQGARMRQVWAAFRA
ncbi:tetratricopeptide repeat protein, partial [Actinomadura roseirufa]|uniref:tetratricopeptide repeat protein n=1 Tax=Actinomadura roseirufa TaxID=2094049 RepID=UPI001F5F7F8F